MTDLQTICGRNAVEALIARRPDDIARLHFVKELAPRFGDICRKLAEGRRIYRMASPEELAALSRTPHHGGVVAVVTPRRFSSPDAAAISRWHKTRECILAFDNIGNPHNMGAMARAAAFLGVQALIVESHSAALLNSSAACRVAEGGMEHLDIFAVQELSAFLRDLPPDFISIGTDQHARHRLADVASDGQVAQSPMVLVMGNEEFGLSTDVRTACRRTVSIPGAGRVESLNVVTAAAICMYALCRKPQ
jgi:TrmH RNA methyltransferase